MIWQHGLASRPSVLIREIRVSSRVRGYTSFDSNNLISLFISFEILYLAK